MSFQVGIGGKRYRYVGFRRARMARRPDNVVSPWSQCPECGAGSLHVRLRGDAVMRRSAMWAPVYCALCGLRFWVRWQAAVDPDAMYARRAGVDRETFRRWRNQALAIYRGDEPHGA